jgi:LTXXQ motif family protein
MNPRGQFAHGQFGGNQGAHSQFAHNQLAHKQFVAQNFHGLQNFTRTGFNRNAFGNSDNWNNWGGRFWGRGWNNWGYGWGGWAGPVFWPFLYGDVFSFVFWPYAYYDPFWVYGPDFLLVSIFAPGPYFGADYGYAPDYGYYGDGGYAGYIGSPNIYYGGSAYRGGSQLYAGATQADRQALTETNAEAQQSCSGLAPGVTDLPIAQIKQTVHPNGEQLATLDDLSAAAQKATDILKASCPTAIPLTPVARLDAAQSRLEATIQAVDVVRDPLARFYDSLSDEQRQSFNAIGNSASGGAPPGGDVAALCGQQSGEVTTVPVRHIQDVVQPNEQQQQAALAALKEASRGAADHLRASCPTQVPQTPVGRLDAVRTRLQAMVDAMNTIRPKLQTFYSSLSDEQKARFNTMAPQNASAATERRGSDR